MKSISIFSVLLFLLPVYSHAQGGQWVWMSGDSLPSLQAQYGTKGIPSVNNRPGGKYEAAEWTDQDNNFWLFGGAGDGGYTKNDLWKYDVSTNEWTWVSGDSSVQSAGNYGTKGIPSPNNIPPSRGYAPVSWTDLDGHFWLFGGSTGYIWPNDLWEYDVSSNEWAWMKGTQVGQFAYSNGIKGIPDTANEPYFNSESPASWVDGFNNLWFYNYYGMLWKYSISSNEWTWMAGDSTGGIPHYGNIGIADSLNQPGSNYTYSRWKDANGNLFFFGGSNSFGRSNNLWSYNPATNVWTWLGGDTTLSFGNYPDHCTKDSLAIPEPRWENRACWSTDNGNQLWTYGGDAGNIYPNDLWYYDLKHKLWVLVYGDENNHPNPTYGTKGIASFDNDPGGRMGAVSWKDNSGNLWLYGGLLAGFGDPKYYGDLWKFIPDTSCFEVFTSGVNVTLDFSINIFPNPTSTSITLSLPSNQNTTLSIFNLLGEKMKEEKVTGTQVTLDVSSLPQGLYLVRTENRVVGKFVKE